MEHCTIYPIPLMVSPSDKSHMTYFANLGQPVCVTGYIWYIKGAKEKRNGNKKSKKREKG